MWLACWKHIACRFQSRAQTGNKQNLVLCEINTANTVCRWGNRGRVRWRDSPKGRTTQLEVVHSRFMPLVWCTVTVLVHLCSNQIIAEYWGEMRLYIALCSSNFASGFSSVPVYGNFLWFYESDQGYLEREFIFQSAVIKVTCWVHAFREITLASLIML